MDKALDSAIRTRAGNLCEYCGMPQAIRRLRFPIDHIVSRQHGGQTVSENLALCCGRCNLHKSPNIAGIDSETGKLTRLFHPRKDRWPDHFRWEGVRIIGTTAVGRTTVHVLDMNHPDDLEVREELILR
ncbi:MAG TPA: HNH endonuclease signature motif containing protein [Tepidisphaeraceae bacterium]|jgi:hypothetical protein|nr:HNH endonuclease signature motif containing protein [Tepidisphaeraceae bacterium]